jgi:hypothetical protein
MKFSPPPGNVALGPTFGCPISSPIQTTAPDLRPPPPGARHCRPGPHSARTLDPPPPSSARPGLLPHLPLPFSLPLCSTKKSTRLLTEIPSPTALSPRPAPPLSLTVRTGAAPNQAPEAGHFFFRYPIPSSSPSQCWCSVPMPDARQRKASC